MSRKSPDPKRDSREDALQEAIPAAGGNRFLARRYGLTSAAVAQWKVCPPDLVLDIEALSGVSRHELRPDVFGEFPQQLAEALWDIAPDEPAHQRIRAFGLRKLAEALGITEAEIEAWPDRQVPPTLVLAVEKVTGIPRHRLRPDAFSPDIPAAQRLRAFGNANLASALGVPVAEVNAWPGGQVPPTFVLDVERVTGISRHDLRPDVFGDAPETTVEEEHKGRPFFKPSPQKGKGKRRGRTRPRKNDAEAEAAA